MDLKLGKVYHVIVTKILTRGIIVSHAGVEDTEFIHISNLSAKFVSNINDIIKIGDEVDALCVTGKISGSPELSLRHLNCNSSYNTRGKKPQPSTSPVDSFESMLAASNKCLEAKMRTLESRSKRRRK